MAGNLFSKAAKYRKQHPGMTMPEAVKAVSKGKDKRAPKKRKAIGRRVTKTTVKTKRRGNKKIVNRRTVTYNIGAISLDKLHREMNYLNSLQTALKGQQELLRSKSLTRGETADVKRSIVKTKQAIAACKKNISSLKRTI